MAARTFPPLYARIITALVCLLACAIPRTARADIWVNVDIPGNGATLQQPFMIGGWAIDTAATTNTGIDAVAVWGYPNYGSGEPAVLVGVATFGPRSDIASAFGAQFLNSGFGLTARGLPPRHQKAGWSSTE